MENYCDLLFRIENPFIFQKRAVQLWDISPMQCGIIYRNLKFCGLQDEDSITAVTYVIQAILDSLSRLDLRYNTRSIIINSHVFITWPGRKIEEISSISNLLMFNTELRGIERKDKMSSWQFFNFFVTFISIEFSVIVQKKNKKAMKYDD